jgi:hypothetical protein
VSVARGRLLTCEVSSSSSSDDGGVGVSTCMVSRTGEVCKSETSRGGSSWGEFFLLCCLAVGKAAAALSTDPIASPFLLGTTRMGAVLLAVP